MQVAEQLTATRSACSIPAINKYLYKLQIVVPCLGVCAYALYVSKRITRHAHGDYLHNIYYTRNIYGNRTQEWGQIPIECQSSRRTHCTIIVDVRTLIYNGRDERIRHNTENL